jgi:tRNA U34 2-thiouridine synthase MnmA/TrmU
MKKTKDANKKTKKTARKAKKTKLIALGLFSGGLDSIVSAKMMKELGFDVRLLCFTSPFSNRQKELSKSQLKDLAGQKGLGLDLEFMPKELDFLDVLRHARHGYGAGMNPCVDCRVYTFKKAKEYAKRIGAAFIFTGEVLGERPLSQTGQALELIERDSGLQGKIVRPLSGKILPSTEAEEKGWLKRNQLLGVSGRGRQTQMQLAQKWHLNYPSPAGGCMLAENHYGLRLKDLFDHRNHIDWEDIAPLSVGRHFRKDKSKIIVGRRETENEQLKKLKGKDDILLECEEGIMGPVTLLQYAGGSAKAIDLAARLTAYFSDARKEGLRKVKVNYWKDWNKGKGKKARPSGQIVVPAGIDMKKEMKKGLVWIGQN